MKADEHLPLTEQVEETRAKAEDRLEQAIVPALDGLFSFIANQVNAAREHLSANRKR